jgi:hypothetical protein
MHFGFGASTSHHAAELHLQQPVYQYDAEVVLVAEEEEQWVQVKGESHADFEFVASTSHHAAELHSEQPVYQYVAEAVLIAEQKQEQEQEQEQAAEVVWVEHIPVEVESHAHPLMELAMVEVMAMVGVEQDVLELKGWPNVVEDVLEDEDIVPLIILANDIRHT